VADHRLAGEHTADEVRQAVAVHVHQQDVLISGTGGHDLEFAKVSRTVIEQKGVVIRLISHVRHEQIQIAVPVQIPEQETPRAGAGWVIHIGLESSVAVAEQHGDAVAGLPLPLDVMMSAMPSPFTSPARDPLGERTGWIGDHRRKRAVAVVQ
jgi:hypothetical protein